MERQNKSFIDQIRHVLHMALVLSLSTSIGLGGVLSNYLVIEAQTLPQIPATEVHVTGGQKEAEAYAQKVAATLALRLSEQGLTARIEIRSGYGCDAQACVTAVYKIDGLTVRDAINISASMQPGDTNFRLPTRAPKPDDPIASNEPSAAAKARLSAAQARFQSAQRQFERTESELKRQLGDLEAENQRLQNLNTNLSFKQTQLNSAISEMNQASAAARDHGTKAAEASQKASNAKTEAERLGSYKKSLADEKSKLEKEVKDLETELTKESTAAKGESDRILDLAKDRAFTNAEARRNESGSVASSHNSLAVSMGQSINLEEDIKGIDTEALIDSLNDFKTPTTSAAGQKLVETKAYLDSARETLKTFTPEQQEPGTRILPVAQATLYAADRAYVRGDNALGDAALRITAALIDLAIGVAPLAILLLAPEATALLVSATIIACAKDFYESYTGRRTLTGETLEPWERGLAIIGFASVIIPGSAVKAGAQGLTKAVRAAAETREDR